MEIPAENESPTASKTNNLTSAANFSSAFKIRFRLTSDASENWDGWYVDDIRIMGYTGGIVGVQGNNSNIPFVYKLEQNFPNPFNPTTLIKYQLPEDEFVKITVFNILGQQVSTLVNTYQNAGNYSLMFDGTNLASGLYLYKLEAGSFTDVKKMLLLK